MWGQLSRVLLSLIHRCLSYRSLFSSCFIIICVSCHMLSLWLSPLLIYLVERKIQVMKPLPLAVSGLGMKCYKRPTCVSACGLCLLHPSQTKSCRLYRDLPGAETPSVIGQALGCDPTVNPSSPLSFISIYVPYVPTSVGATSPLQF